MEIKVKMTLSIGQTGGREEEETIEVPDNWYSLSREEQEPILDYHWKEWAWNYIDGGCWEDEGD